MPEYISALDIGSSKTVVLIVEEKKEVEPQRVNIIGFGEAESEGIEKGTIKNPEKFFKTVKDAIGDAEKMANTKIDNIAVGLTSPNLKSTSSEGTIALSSKDKSINTKDIAKVKKAAKAIPLENRQIIDTIDQKYIVDDKEEYEPPVGMSGVRLETVMTLLTIEKENTDSLMEPISRLGIKVNNTFANPRCEGAAILDKSEKELGTILIDMGADTTEVSIWMNNKLKEVIVLEYAGNSITKDLSICLELPFEKAEELKKQHGHCIRNQVDDTEIEIPGIGARENRTVSKKLMTKIIAARLEEILDLAKGKSGELVDLDSIRAGVVLSGGTALTEGILELTESTLEMPAKISMPKVNEDFKDMLNNPKYSSSVGVAVCKITQEGDEIELQEESKLKKFFENLKSKLFKKL